MELLSHEDTQTVLRPIIEPSSKVTFRLVPALAQEIGLNESILLLQLDYLISITNERKDGRWWRYGSATKLQETTFPFWSKSTVDRTIRSLENSGYIIVGNYNKWKNSTTRWYALNPEKLKTLVSVQIKRDSQGKPYIATDTLKVIPILPELAKEIGLGESIVLMQLNHLIGLSDNLEHLVDGQFWTNQSTSQLNEEFPFWSRGTVSNKIQALYKAGYIDVANHGYRFGNETKSFALNVEKLSNLHSIKIENQIIPYEVKQHNMETVGKNVEGVQIWDEGYSNLGQGCSNLGYTRDYIREYDTKEQKLFTKVNNLANSRSRELPKRYSKNQQWDAKTKKQGTQEPNVNSSVITSKDTPTPSPEFDTNSVKQKSLKFLSNDMIRVTQGKHFEYEFRFNKPDVQLSFTHGRKQAGLPRYFKHIEGNKITGRIPTNLTSLTLVAKAVHGDQEVTQKVTFLIQKTAKTNKEIRQMDPLQEVLPWLHVLLHVFDKKEYNAYADIDNLLLKEYVAVARKMLKFARAEYKSTRRKINPYKFVPYLKQWFEQRWDVKYSAFALIKHFGDAWSDYTKTAEYTIFSDDDGPKQNLYGNESIYTEEQRAQMKKMWPAG